MMKSWAQVKDDVIDKELDDYYIDSVVCKSTPLELVDLFGTVMLKTEISDGKVDLDISQFKTGQYKVIIRTSEKPIYSNFNISR